MGIRDKAVALAATDADKARQYNQEQANKRRDTLTAQLLAFLQQLDSTVADTDVKYAGAKKYPLFKVLHSGYAFARVETTRLDPVDGWRFQAPEGLIFVCTRDMGNDRWTLEVACAVCDTVTLPARETLGIEEVWVNTKPGDHELKQIAKILQGKWVCGPCQANHYDATCSKCGQPLA